MGEAAGLIAAAVDGAPASDRPRVAHERAATLEAAVARPAELARPGEAGAPSPACSSYALVQNYEPRGPPFPAAGEALPTWRPRDPPPVARGGGGPARP